MQYRACDMCARGERIALTPSAHGDLRRAVELGSHHRHSERVVVTISVSLLLCELRVEQSALAKVSQFGNDFLSHQNVVGFDITMNQRLPQIMVKVSQPCRSAERERVAEALPRGSAAVLS